MSVKTAYNLRQPALKEASSKNWWNQSRYFLYGISWKIFTVFWIIMGLLYFIDFLPHMYIDQSDQSKNVISGSGKGNVIALTLGNLIINPFISLVYVRIAIKRIIKEEGSFFAFPHVLKEVVILITLGIIGSFAFYGVLNLFIFISPDFMTDTGEKMITLFRNFPEAILAILAFFGLNLAYFYLGLNSELEDENRELKLELESINRQGAEHEINNLFSYIQIYAQDRPHSMDRLIRQVKKFINYLVLDRVKSKILLTDEIYNIENYIQLRLLEFDQSTRDAATVKISTVADTDYYIVPGVLIEYIRNAFKHGFKPSKLRFLHIEIYEKQGALNFIIENSVPEKHTVIKGLSMHRDRMGGLQLNKRLLDIHYKGRYSLLSQKREEDHTYITHLTLQLNG